MSSSIRRSRNLNFIFFFHCGCVITLQHQHFLRFSPKQHQTSNTHVTPAAARQSFVPPRASSLPSLPSPKFAKCGRAPLGASPHLGKFRRGKRGKRGHRHSPSAKGQPGNHVFVAWILNLHSIKPFRTINFKGFRSRFIPLGEPPPPPPPPQVSHLTRLK